MWDKIVRNELYTLEPLQKEERRAQILGVIIGLVAGIGALIMFGANGTCSSMLEFRLLVFLGQSSQALEIA